MLFHFSYEFQDGNGLLSSNQTAFRPNTSDVNKLVIVTHNIGTAIDKNLF